MGDARRTHMRLSDVRDGSFAIIFIIVSSVMLVSQLRSIDVACGLFSTHASKSSSVTPVPSRVSSYNGAAKRTIVSIIHAAQRLTPTRSGGGMNLFLSFLCSSW